MPTNPPKPPPKPLTEVEVEKGLKRPLAEQKPKPPPPPPPPPKKYLNFLLFWSMEKSS